MSSRHIRGHLVFKSNYEHTEAGDVAAADLANMSLLLVNKDSGAATGVTLPAPGYVGQAWLVVDAKGDAASNNITITPASGNINGSGTYVISENYGAVLLVWDGTNYTIAAASKDNQTVAAQTVTTLTATTANITTGNITTANITTGVIDGRRHGDVGTLAAAGSVQANAGVIANRFTIVTGADNTKCVILPAAVEGDEYWIYSSTATNGLPVFPPVNGTINDGSANAAVTIEGKTLSVFIATSNSNYATMFTANS